MLGKLLLYSMLMIVAFGLALSGVMMLTVAPEPTPLAAWPMALGGVLVGGFSLWQIVVINRLFQEQAWSDALADTASLYARWTDADGRELLLAKSGFFIDKKYYAFAESYSSLSSIRIEGDELRVSVAVRGKRGPVVQTQQVRVPAEHAQGVARGVEELCAGLDDEPQRGPQ